MSEAVRRQWEALLLALQEQPDEYQGIEPGYVPMRGMVNQCDHRITVEPPDIQQTIANQVELTRRLDYQEEPEPAPAKKPNWGRLMTRGR